MKPSASSSGRNAACRVVLAAVAWITVAWITIAAAQAFEEPRSIFVMQRDGSAVRHVVAVKGARWHGSPRWSHDGARLAFDAYGPAICHIYVVNVDGKNLRDMGPGSSPSWSPDDKQLIFETSSGVWVQNVNGRGRERLAAGGAARWSPDGGQIAIGRPFRLLDMVDGTEKPGLEPGEQVSETFGFEWSPDAKRLAVIGERYGQRELLIMNAGGAGAVPRLVGNLHNSVAWSPDGTTLAITTYDQQRTARRVQLLSVDGSELPEMIAGQEGDNSDACWSPDGKQLAFVSSRPAAGAESVAEVAVYSVLKLVRAHDSGGTCYSVALTPDGRTALVGTDYRQRRMQLWDVTTGEVQRNIMRFGIQVALSPDGKFAAAAERQKPLVAYLKVEDGSTVRELTHRALVTAMAFSGDGSRLLTGDRVGNASVYEVVTGKELARIKTGDPMRSLAISPDGQLVATAGPDQVLRLWSVESGRQVREIAHQAVIWSIAFTPSGRAVATGTGGTPQGVNETFKVPVGPDNNLRLWDVASGDLIRQINGHTDVVTSIAISADGSLLVSGSFDHTVRLWDLHEGRELSRITGKGWVTKVVMSANGLGVVAAGGLESDSNIVFPDERVRYFQVVAGGAAPAGQK